MPPRPALGLLLLLAACGEMEGPGFDLDLEDDATPATGDRVCDGYPGGTLSGDDPLVRVNKDPDRQLRSDWSPADLAPIDDAFMIPGRAGSLRAGALVALRGMLAAVRTETGATVRVRSPYRSFVEQCITYESKVQTNGAEHAARFSARPGRSEHQLGMTADVTSNGVGNDLVQSFGDRPEGRWLAENAWQHGFGLSYPEGREDETGYGYEPWHFRFIGVAAAAEMHAQGMSLFQYLRACEEDDGALECPRVAAPPVNAGFIGGPCTDDAVCAGIGTGAFCRHHADTGECTLPCTSLCPDRDGLVTGTFCRAAPEGAGTCASRCDTDLFGPTGCRPGWTCEPADRPDGSGSARVCVPSAD